MLNLEINQVIPLEITALSNQGYGIGRYNNIAVFVPTTAVGDIISARITGIYKNHCFAELKELSTPSTNRVENKCKAYPACGGCSLRHISYESELKAKESFVQENLARIGKSQLKLEGIIPSPITERYRNKAQYPVGIVNGEVAIGFYEKGSHNLIPLEDCLIQPKQYTKICSIVKDFLTEFNIPIYNEETHKGIARHIYIRSSADCKEIMVTIVVNSNTLPKWESLCDRLTQSIPEIVSVNLSINTKKTNVVLGNEEKLLYGKSYITDDLLGVNLQLSSKSFYQVNREATQLLYKKVEDYAQLTGEEVLLDLYCGIGSIGLTLAQSVKELVGIEIVARAVKDAEENAQRNNITNARFIKADAGKGAQQLKKQGLLPDVIVVDPPRKGLDENTISAVVEMQPTRVVYVSCNSATLARDIKRFADQGYNAVKGTAVDLFPRTPHVEAVVLLEKE